MRHVDPVAFEDVLDFKLEQLFIGEDVAAAAENTVFRVVLNGTVKTGLKFIEIGLCKHQWFSSLLPQRVVVRLGWVEYRAAGYSPTTALMVLPPSRRKNAILSGSSAAPMPGPFGISTQKSR